MKKIISVVGARPNFMKMAPLHRELAKYSKQIKHIIIHTGQHYDIQLSDVFFRELELPKPDINLGAGSDSHGQQTASIMSKLEKIIQKEMPDLVIVYGDVNSTLAASVICSKILNKKGKPIPLAHVEAGLRSFDRTMPEEINRIVTDSIADYLFVPEKDGIKNLFESGVPLCKIYFTGNIMIDSLLPALKKSEKSTIKKELCISKKSYALVTLHRPSNVDLKDMFENILRILTDINKISSELDIVFPVHPRTIAMAKKHGLKKKLESIRNLIITEPLGYFDFISLLKSAKFIITDSGGVQEETSYLGIPCLTLRENTERPVTVKHGTNTICGRDRSKVAANIRKIESGKYKKGGRIKYYDGKTAQRIAKIIVKKILAK